MYLYVGQFFSKKRTAQALAELFGAPVSEGTVATMTRRAADGLGGFLARLTDRLADAEVAGFDVTGLRVAGKLHWVHCARTDKYALITCHPKRGRKGTDDAGVLGRFQGLAVHDAWAPYDTYPGVEQKHNALSRRLIDRQDDYLRFTTDPRILADKNGSERDIRMIKLRQKVSGCLRTLTGAKQFCAICSYLSTATKHGRHFFDSLVMLAGGRPGLPANPMT